MEKGIAFWDGQLCALLLSFGICFSSLLLTSMLQMHKTPCQFGKNGLINHFKDLLNPVFAIMMQAERSACSQKLDLQTLKTISVYPEALLFGDVRLEYSGYFFLVPRDHARRF